MDKGRWWSDEKRQEVAVNRFALNPFEATRGDGLRLRLQGVSLALGFSH